MRGKIKSPQARRIRSSPKVRGRGTPKGWRGRTARKRLTTARTHIRRILLTGFRSYARAELDVAGGPVVLTGPNGAGKTNLLEAVSLLTPGKGLRGAGVAEIGRREPQAVGGAPWSVAAVVASDDGDTQLGTGLEPGAGRRTVRLDDQTVAPARLAAHLRLVWLTPGQDRLFVEPASERRRFLDRLVYAAEPEHASRVSAYERAMRERLRVLLDAREAGRAPDPAWLDALEARLAQSGAAVATARSAGVAGLATEIDARGDRPFPRARLSLAGDWCDADAEDFEPRLRLALQGSRARDAAAGRGLVGPHRADLVVIHRETGRPAGEGSTGEQKALGLNLVLAQAARLARTAVATSQTTRAESAPNPILLLDEVAAHLDPQRRAALFEEITALGLQTFLTGTDRRLFNDLEGRAQFVRVDAGRFILGAQDLDPT